MIAHCRLTKKLSTYVFQVPDPRFGVRLFLLLTGYQPQSSPTAISPGIARGFARNAELYDDNIDLATYGGKVTLSDTVATQMVSLVRKVVALVLAVANCSKPHCLIKVTSTSRCWPTRSLASSTSARDHASACTAPSSQQEESAVPSGQLVITLAPNILLVLLGWCLAQMSFHAPRLDSPLALLSSFKLFLIATTICGSGFGMSFA